jgi:hypothetical protein
MNWDAVVQTLKTKKYQRLKGQGLWTPQVTTKKRDDNITGLHVALNKLSYGPTPVHQVEETQVAKSLILVLDATSVVTSQGTLLLKTVQK